MSEQIAKEHRLLDSAICFATERHAGQVRKGSSTPYITHPMETMSILATMKADTALLIAGVLHDTVEDTDTTLMEISAKFGDDVAALVAAHTEDKSKTWDERKQHSIDELKTASKRVKMLVMADKVSNLRSMYTDYKTLGDDLWKRFNAPQSKQAWYYSMMQEALREMKDHPETETVYREMMGLIKDIFDSD